MLNPKSNKYKKLRLKVMLSIQHPEQYYQQALKSLGIDYRVLTHDQISVWIAQLKSIEADLIIQSAYENEYAELTPELLGGLTEVLAPFLAKTGD